MKLVAWLGSLIFFCSLLACTGGSSGTGGDFALIEFLESGQNNIPRNRQVRFRFSQPVAPGQDLYSRLKIQNVEQLSGKSNFSNAQGFYVLNAEMVIFTPRIPNKPDRSDAGFRADGNYHVYLSGGPNGLRSTQDDTIPTQQEFIFETNKFFEDIVPQQPPRALQLLAVDPTGVAPDKDISRCDPRPFELANKTNQDLLDKQLVIEPGAGGAANNYSTPWHLELRVSEPLDPSQVNGATVRLFEIRENAFATAPDEPDPSNPRGDPVNFRVPITVKTVQGVDAVGNYDIRIRVTPLQTLVDNTRYRLSFAGQVLGIDYRDTLTGSNGLTGDGTTLVDNGTAVFAEPGGLGYVSEFLVYDRPAVSSARTLEYDPFVDGIQPENGQTATSEEDLNSALYNPSQSPSTALGFLSAFGRGDDGNFSVAGGATFTLDTGDTPNEPLGLPFSVLDLNPTNDYLGNPLPGALVSHDSVEPFEYQLESMTVSTGATLKIIGVNPVMFRVTGIAQIAGEIDISGGNGVAASVSNAVGGAAGAGGFPGGRSRRGSTNCTSTFASCTDFATFLNTCSASASFPNALNGAGPGRGFAGGEMYNYDYVDDRNNSGTGTGGGGAGHGLIGGDGEDRTGAGSEGSTGSTCAQITGIRNSSVIGVRSKGGAKYGDRLVADITVGGSGGAGGGNTYAWGGNAKATSGGGGGGGGGSISIIAAGSILVTGGNIDASGGDGGKGNMGNGTNGWVAVGGGGGGGAGGTIALISGADIQLTPTSVNAVGGSGGARADNVSGGCNGCNAGGDGGKGFVFLMDADGKITGFLPGDPGEYDNDARGILTISKFDATRFSSITAITELFPMSAAKPAYDEFLAKDIEGKVNNLKQRIVVLVSAAEGNPDNPTVAQPSTEREAFEVAELVYDNGPTKVNALLPMAGLNEIPGMADRFAFVRVRAAFEYEDGVEAALGPFATISKVTIRYTFNG